MNITMETVEIVAKLHIYITLCEIQCSHYEYTTGDIQLWLHLHIYIYIITYITNL